MQSIIEKAKIHFCKMINDFGSDPYNILSHVHEVEKWARFMTRKYPQANEEVVMISVWMHDIGHYPVPTNIDHAIRSEERTKEFLTLEGYHGDKAKEVLHCVRAHRYNDVIPQTLEAKIIAFVDSASHMTDSLYFDIAKADKERNDNFRVYAKMERDLRDLSSFPEVKKELINLYDAWRNLIKEYEKINFV